MYISKAYKHLQNIVDQKKNKGPIYLLADWNARLVYPMSEEEQEIMGTHTLHTNADYVQRFSEDMRDNRNLFTELCIANGFKVMNTMFRKRPEKLATYRKPKSIDEHPTDTISADTHEQLDYIRLSFAL